MKLKDLENYYQSLLEKFNGGKPDFALNTDRAHNSTVVRFMLDHSKNINMYCGEMSVFRNSFYQKINEENKSDIGNNIKELLITSLRHYVEVPESQLIIYFENFHESYFNDIISFDLFKEAASRGKICFYKLNDSLFLKDGLSHITYTDTQIVRMERDKITHEATCAIHTPKEIIDSLQLRFKSMQSAAELIVYPN